MIEVLRAMQQADSAFPSGGFAFSQGLEGWAAEFGRPDPEHLQRFILQQIRQRWATADRVALLRAHSCVSRVDALAEIDRAFDRTQVIEVLRNGSRRNGRALLAAHCRLGTEGAASIKEAADRGTMIAHLPIVQGALWRALGIGPEFAVVAAGYACAASLVTAAVRLNMVGAIRGQKLLAGMLHDIAAAAIEPVRPDTLIASFAPFTEIAAMRGAGGHSRLFFN